MSEEFDIELIDRMSRRNPGALRVVMELLYEHRNPEAVQKLLAAGIVGVDLFLLYKACEYSGAVIITRVFDGTAMRLLQTNPESIFYGK